MKLSKQTLVIIILSVFVCALFGFIIWWQAELASEYSDKPDDLKSVYEYVCSARGTYHPNEIELSLDEASGKIKLIYKRGSEKLVQKLLTRFEEDGISPDYFELVELYFQNQPLIEELDDELDFEACGLPDDLSKVHFTFESQKSVIDAMFDSRYEKLLQNLYQSEILLDKTDFITVNDNIYYASNDMSIKSIDAVKEWFYFICDESVLFENITSTPNGNAPVFIEENEKLYVIEGYLAEDVKVLPYYRRDVEDGALSLITTACTVSGNRANREEYADFCRYFYHAGVGFDVTAQSAFETSIITQPDGTLKFGENIFEKMKTLPVYEDTVDYTVCPSYLFAYKLPGVIKCTVDYSDDVEIVESDEVAQMQKLIDKARYFKFRIDNNTFYRNDNGDYLSDVVDSGIDTKEDANRAFYEIFHPDTTMPLPNWGEVSSKLVYAYWYQTVAPLVDMRVCEVKPIDENTRLVTLVKIKEDHSAESLPPECLEYASKMRLWIHIIDNEPVFEITVAKNDGGEWRISECMGLKEITHLTMDMSPDY